MRLLDEFASGEPLHPPTVSETFRLPPLAVVIPSFRAAGTIGAVLAAIGPEVARIYVVDDGCPDSTGERALRDSADPRVVVLHNDRNLGVGGAMKRGSPTAPASWSSSMPTARWTRATSPG
jgi:hypothetical protein